MQSFQKTVFHLDEKQDFSKLFPELKPLEISDEQLRQLAHLMIERDPCQDSQTITNGEAIFSQFLAHDITFESTSKFRGINMVQHFQNDRTFNLDLDCVYGQWTQDFLYDKNDKNKLLLGCLFNDGERGNTWIDLQRNDQDKAIIPDARNDENIIVSQIQSLMIQFHNKVVDKIRDETNRYGVFMEARKEVIWHYQWLIIHGYLAKMLDPQIFANLCANGPEYYCLPQFLPLEFTGAAFRTGHSQTREDNYINEYTRKNLFELGSFGSVDDFIDWRFFFDFGDGCVQPAKLLDTKISKSFHKIPFIQSDDPWLKSLPFRNLRRGVTYGLPSGEDVAKRLCVTPIELEECQSLGLNGTPLWYYILREAELLGNNGEHLGPVGSILLGEVFFSIMLNDDDSFMKVHPKWKPTLGMDPKNPDKFDFTDLVKFVNHSKSK